MKLVLVVLLLFSLPLVAKDKPRVPLPSELLNAKTAAITGGPPSVLDHAFDELNKWGRFQLVSNPDSADIVFDFAFWEMPVGGFAGRTAHHETLIIHGRQTDALYQDARMWETTFVPKNGARQMIKELRHRIEKQ